MGLKRNRFSKEGLLALSIIVVAYLLISSYQIMNYRYLELEGEYEVQYTTPIPQQTNYTLSREPYLSTNSAVILNVTLYKGMTNYYLPRFDYDLVTFNLTLEPKSSQREVEFSIRTGLETIANISQIVTNKTTLTLQTDFSAAENSYSSWWLVETWISISPFDDFICHSLIVLANSSVPLSPVSIDIQSTNGESLYENDWMIEMRDSFPVLYAAKDNVSSSYCRVYPRVTNHTIYLRPGVINGSCYWRNFEYDEIEFNSTIYENEKLHLIFHLKAVEIELSFDTNYPVHYLYWSTGTYEDAYYFYTSPNKSPISLYVPPDDAHVIFALVDTMEITRVRLWWQDTLAQASGDIDIDGSYNIQISIRLQSALNVYFTQSALIGMLTLSLFFLIILLLARWIISNQSGLKRKLGLDLRIIPFFIFLILAFIPWFSSNHVYEIDWDKTFSVQSVSIGSLPIVGTWTEGSIFLVRVPEYALAWSVLSILLYWLPLIWSIAQIRKPINRENDKMTGMVLAIPAGFFCFSNQLSIYLADSLPGPLVVHLAGFAIPITWLLLVGILSRRGYYSNNGTNGNNGNLEIENQESELIESVELQSPEQVHHASSKKLISHPSLISISRFCIGFTFAILFPCMIGYYYHAWNTNPHIPSTFFVSPTQALGFQFDLGFSTVDLVTLSSLLVGIPYAAFTALSLVWLWDLVDKRRSADWVLLPSLVGILSMIPGVAILNMLGMIRYPLAWYRWTPFPILSLFTIFATFAILYVRFDNASTD